MLRRFRRSLPLAAALSVVAGIVAVAGAIVPGTDEALVLVCPPSVVAGSPINGYVTGGLAPRYVNAVIGMPPGVPHGTSGPQDPLYFSFPTLECDQGTVTTVVAGEGGGQMASQPVQIM